MSGELHASASVPSGKTRGGGGMHSKSSRLGQEKNLIPLSKEEVWILSIITGYIDINGELFLGGWTSIIPENK